MAITDDESTKAMLDIVERMQSMLSASCTVQAGAYHELETIILRELREYIEDASEKRLTELRKEYPAIAALLEL